MPSAPAWLTERGLNPLSCQIRFEKKVTGRPLACADEASVSQMRFGRDGDLRRCLRFSNKLGTRLFLSVRNVNREAGSTGQDQQRDGAWNFVHQHVHKGGARRKRRASGFRFWVCESSPC